MDKGLRAVFYARVSTDEEKQLNALSKQIQENRQVIKEKGWICVKEYIDEGKTGTTTKRRTAYKKMLEDMLEDKFDIIVCKDQDRLQRNTLDWYLFVDRLVNRDIKLYMYLDNKFFTPSEDALITGIKAIIAEEYSRNLSKKLNNSNKRRIERALRGEGISAMGNSKALGYAIKDKQWVKVPEEIKVCKLIFELYLKYDSLRKVRDEINNLGYRNSVGKPFTTESISRILKNEKAKGVIVLGHHHHDFDKKKIVKMPEEEWVRVQAPELAYISEEIFDKVQERLKAKTGNKRGKNVGRDILSGKLFCSKCGKVMWRRETSHKDKDGNKKTYYHWRCSQQYAKGGIVCEGVGTTTVKVMKIYEDLTKDLVVNKKAVKDTMLEWLYSLQKQLKSSEAINCTSNAIKRLKTQKERLTEAYLDEIISKDDYKKKYTAIETELEALTKELEKEKANDDLREIEETIANIDKEIEEYIGAEDFEASKIEFLLEHTKSITVVNSNKYIIDIDLIAGVIIAGEDFLLYVHDSMHYCVQTTKYTVEFRLVA